MARPERNNVDYFPHPVKHGKKMNYIEKKYKNDGYAIWFKIIEELGDANYHYLDLSNEVQIMYLEEKCNSEKSLIFDVINDLVKLGEFESNFWEYHKILFSEKFVKSIEDVYNRRNSNCIQLHSLCKHLLDKGIQLHNKCIQSSCKKPQTKLNQTKLNYNRDKFPFLGEIINSNILNFEKMKKIISINEELIGFQDAGFIIFWDEYHIITKKQKTDKEKAWDIWKEMSIPEQKRAFENIENYFKSLNDKKYCKKLYIYLQEKIYENNFNTKKPKLVI